MLRMFRRKTQFIELKNELSSFTLRVDLGTPIKPPIQMNIESDELQRIDWSSDRVNGVRLTASVRTTNEVLAELLADAVRLEVWRAGVPLAFGRIKSMQYTWGVLTIYAEDDHA